MQVAYEEEAEGIESLKMQPFIWCNQRTNLHEPAYSPHPAAPYNAVSGNSRKFTGKSSPV